MQDKVKYIDPSFEKDGLAFVKIVKTVWVTDFVLELCYHIHHEPHETWMMRVFKNGVHVDTIPHINDGLPDFLDRSGW